jgi:hypothetical protein
MSMRFPRRQLLRLLGAGTLAGATGAWRARGTAAQPASDVEGRTHDLLGAFDGQGHHRTGTEIDRASGDWLHREAARAGGMARLVPFSFARLDVLEAYVEIGGQRIEGLPFFDGGVTDATGVTGPIGSEGVQLAVADRAAISTEGEFLAEARRAGRVGAIVVVTSTSVPGLVPSNARAFTAPYGCPVLQVGSEARGVLDAAARSGATARVVCRTKRTDTTAVNVEAEVPGRDASLAPLLVITPRSGWWTCAAERGGGLVCWLETMRALAGSRPARRTMFVASSGHELGHLGLEAFLHANDALLRTAHACIHLGANIGAGGATAPGALLQASHDALDDMTSAALTDAGAAIAGRLPRGRVPAGEARNLHVGGARYVSLIGQGNAWFHHQDDRYPAAVTADRVARYARAVAAAATRLTSA